LIKAFILASLAIAAAPPVLALRSVTLAKEGTTKTVRFATPGLWKPASAIEPHSVRLVDPERRGEITVLVATQPQELGVLLSRLKDENPNAQPSPPEFVKVEGIDPEKGERATRFIITGDKAGEMVMIERGGAIVLFATIVPADTWKELRSIMARCYPTVAVQEEKK
jgi:hypothetical protein